MEAHAIIEAETHVVRLLWRLLESRTLA